MKTMIFILICVFALLGGMDVDAGIYSPSSLRVSSTSTIAVDNQVYIDNTIYSSQFTIQNLGNVGIGTLYPRAMLEVDGSLYLNDRGVNPHIKITQDTAPTVATPKNCGVSPSASVTAGSTDTAGSFSITAGSGSITTCDTVITFNNAFLTAPKAVLVTNAPTTTGTYQYFPRVVSTTTFDVIAPSAPAVGLTQKTYYWVIE